MSGHAPQGLSPRTFDAHDVIWIQKDQFVIFQNTASSVCASGDDNEYRANENRFGMVHVNHFAVRFEKVQRRLGARYQSANSASFHCSMKLLVSHAKCKYVVD